MSLQEITLVTEKYFYIFSFRYRSNINVNLLQTVVQKFTIPDTGVCSSGMLLLLTYLPFLGVLEVQVEL
ncbi:hypothetical protein YYU_02045 [Anaplasma phagocytophilum str. HZ2]|nr:hypothetical protein YYU_02045 [Anaplasma phagocytophilum str. HZ2]AGR81818.1 hypothetical protein YYY_02080 [Anaplasma phagocytophilum str. Dog2]KDB56190.1 hypothetical protein O997_02085 [Anaplasma phagocytophilum str. MRK]